MQNDGRPTLNDVAEGGRRIDVRTRVAVEAFLLALSTKPQPPLVMFYCTFPPPRFFARYTRWGHHEWRSFWARGMDHPSVRAYLQVMHSHAGLYETVSERYGSAVVALQRSLWPAPFDTAKAIKYWLSDLPENDWNHHPGRDVHHMVADAIFHAWQRLLGAATPQPTFRGVEPLASKAVLDSWRASDSVDPARPLSSTTLSWEAERRLLSFSLETRHSVLICLESKQP